MPAIQRTIQSLWALTMNFKKKAPSCSDNCWYNDVSLMNFETGKIVEEEFSGGFTDYDLTSTMNA